MKKLLLLAALLCLYSFARSQGSILCSSAHGTGTISLTDRLSFCNGTSSKTYKVSSLDSFLNINLSFATTTGTLAQFGATTSSQFKGVISDENAPDGASSKVIMALGSLSIATGKTATFSKTLTFDGTDATTMTFPTTSASIARTDAGQTFTGTQTFGDITATTLNGNTFTSGTYTLTGQAGKTLSFNGSITLTGTDAQTYTFPTTSATLARTDAANTFTGTQTIGALVATTFNGNTFTTGTGTLTLGAGKTTTFDHTSTFTTTDGQTYTFPTTSATIARTDAANTFTGVQTMTSPVFNTGVSGTAFGTGVATFLTTPSSANLFSAITDETGGTLLVGSASPTFTGTVALPIITTTGKLTIYNGIATVSNGLPSEVASIDLTAQGAAIAATTAYSVPALQGGMYEVSWVATITTAATTSCVLGGATGLQLKYTDNDDNVVKTENPTTATVSAVNATGTSISGVEVCSCKGSTNLQYIFGYTSVGVTPMQYNLHIKIKQL